MGVSVRFQQGFEHQKVVSSSFRESAFRTLTIMNVHEYVSLETKKESCLIKTSRYLHGSSMSRMIFENHLENMQAGHGSIKQMCHRNSTGLIA